MIKYYKFQTLVIKYNIKPCKNFKRVFIYLISIKLHDFAGTQLPNDFWIRDALNTANKKNRMLRMAGSIPTKSDRGFFWKDTENLFKIEYYHFSAPSNNIKMKEVLTVFSLLWEELKTVTGTFIDMIQLVYAFSFTSAAGHFFKEGGV